MDQPVCWRSVLWEESRVVRKDDRQVRGYQQRWRRRGVGPGAGLAGVGVIHPGGLAVASEAAMGGTFSAGGGGNEIQGKRITGRRGGFRIGVM